MGKKGGDRANTEGAVPTPALRWSGWRASVPPRHGGGLSFGGRTACQPIIQSSSTELGSQIVPKESNVGSGLGAHCYTAGRAVCSRHAKEHGAAPKAKANIQNAAFPSWHSPPVRGCFLSKAELLLFVINQREWSISSLLLPPYRVFH